MNKIIIPKSAYQYIIYQQTSIKTYGDVEKMFNEQILTDYESMKDFLPGKCHAILDIGCGVCGIDVALYNHYDRSEYIRFYLLDRTEISKLVYGFSEKPAFYNSLDVAKELLSSNGILPKQLNFIEAPVENGTFALTLEMNLVISLFAWGFHFPVLKYISQVYQLLGSGGKLIIDIRKGTDGRSELVKYFGNDIRQILEDKKYIRVVATK